MRLFIAIELSKEIKNQLTAIQERLKAASADVKWVLPDNIHLTLKFIGKTESSKIASITKILNKVSRKFKAFKIGISGLGAFPSLNSPRVIWAGADKAEIISDIAKILEEELEKLGLAKEKRGFECHLTLGRLRSLRNLDALRETVKKNIEFKAGTFAVTNISLIESKLTPQGPIYSVIYTASLS